MVFFAVIKSELEEELEFDEIIANQDGVVCLTNASNVDIRRIIKINAKISFLWNIELLIIQNFISYRKSIY